MMSEAAYVKPNGAVHEEPPAAVFAEVRQMVRRSDDVKDLVVALIKAQQEFDTIAKDAENEAYSRGTKKSRYATLASVVEATRPALNKNGLTIMQHVQSHNATKETVITTTLIHVSGQFWESDLVMPSVNQQGRFDPQTVASATTYGRRVAWLGICGGAPADDDDGNAASGIGSKAAADEVAKQKLADLSKHPDAHIAGMAKDSLAKINAVSTAKDLEGTLKASLESQKDDGLFDTVSGTVQQVRQMATSPAKGNRPYRKIALTIIEKGELKDVEISAFENFKMSDTTCFAALDDFTTEGGTATLIVERSGKYLNLKDIKQLGARAWDNRLGVVQR
jgi:hypothetical protein